MSLNVFNYSPRGIMMRILEINNQSNPSLWLLICANLCKSVVYKNQLWSESE